MPKKLDYELLQRITRRAFVQMVAMIHKANDRDNQEPGDPKVGGHPAACSSCMELLAALHLVVRDPADYVCCKPHASPTDHALHHQLALFRDRDGGWLDDAQSERVMERLRDFPDDGGPVFQSSAVSLQCRAFMTRTSTRLWFTHSRRRASSFFQNPLRMMKSSKSSRTTLRKIQT